MKRIVVASVGFNWSRTLRGIYGIGLYPNDIVILVNSKPEKEDAVKAMNIIKDRLSEVGVKALELWLNPIEPFELNVARVRSLIERCAPCSVVILIAGGFRWITTVLIFSATVLNTIGNLARDSIIVEKIRIEIEEEIEGIDITDSKPLYIEIHRIPKLINLTIEDYEILKIIGQNQDIRQNSLTKKSIIKIKDIANQSGKPRTTIIRKLLKLEKIGLITREVQGRYYTYKLTDIGKMLAINT
ncbi:MAG: CRISPR-associated CARF protein Csa3 [Ignisphaera sp.]